MPSLLHERTAIVHDWFQGYHGAERVVDAMRAGLFAEGSEPDILTFQAARELLPAPLAEAIKGESRLARLPGLRQEAHHPGHWRALLPYMPHYFAHLDLSPYDTVIASSHSCAVQARPRGEALYVCYCHTPIRYAWLPETEARRASGLAGLGLRLTRGWLRRKDLEASRRPDGYIANSTAVQERIRTAYGRDSEVVHPPVDVENFSARREKEPGSFLWVHRLVAYKRPEVVVEAFRDLPLKLTMVGVGPLAERLRRNLPPNVELIGWLPRHELVERYERASGFIHVAEEDFGMSMVEALAAGTPVVALARGGATDIVRPDEDGMLLEAADPGTLRAAVLQIAERDWDREALADRARLFSRERFVDGLLEAIDRFRRAKS
jgi:glycosyltransferase involved in cell wall biosynthesis